MAIMTPQTLGYQQMLQRRKIALQLAQQQGQGVLAPPADSSDESVAPDYLDSLINLPSAPAPSSPQLAPQGSPQSSPQGSQPSGGDQSTDDVWEARSRGIAGIESGGEKDPYATISAPTRGDRAYGKYQVMGANIPQWTQAATGTALTPQQFLNAPKVQEATFRHQFGSYVDKYGEEGAARAWYGGEGGMKNLGATDVYGRLNVGQYGQDYVRRMGNILRSR
jgi:hypothetical protein